MRLIIEQPIIHLKEGIPMLWYDVKEELQTGNPDCRCSYCRTIVEENAIRIEDGFSELILHQECFLHLQKKENIIIKPN